MNRLVAAVLLLCFLPCIGQQPMVSSPDEPINLGMVKQQLNRYHSCLEPNCYEPQVEHQADVAVRFLKQAIADAKRDERLALVLDIDETALSNWSVELHDDFSYIPNDWHWCVTLKCGTAIPGTLRLFREAEQDNVAVFFISGRPETQREATSANLKTVGYDHWEGLYLRPEVRSSDQSASQFKSAERARIIASGYTIVLNVGDQVSDLVGDPQANNSVKLPNPFYFIP